MNNLSIEDERGIQDVLHRYCAGIDRRDWTLFRTCFTDDLQADYSSFGTWSSGDELTEVMEAMHAQIGPTLHRLTNIMISEHLGGAQARSYVDAILTKQNPNEPPSRGLGYYDDDLIRTSTGWKIARRRFVAVHVVV